MIDWGVAVVCFGGSRFLDYLENVVVAWEGVSMALQCYEQLMHYDDIPIRFER